jgi:general stress protein YciG
MNTELTEEEKLKKKLSKAGSIMGKISQLKHPKTKEFMSEIGKKGGAKSALRFKDPLDK